MAKTPRITLEQWHALVTVVDAGSYARAAERLHKSQSSVTYAVQKIESLLGVKAFDIQGRKAVLTPTGQLLYRRARVLLDEAGNVETAAGRLSAGWEAEIRVAMEQIFPIPVMLESLDRFNRESPHTHIELIESVLGGTAEALLRAHADLAITPIVPPGFLGESLLRMRFLPVAHPDHPLHKLGRALTNDDLRTHRHLIVRESGSARSTRPSVDAAQRWTVSHMATSIEAARTGYGFAWLPEEKIREELANKTLKPLPLREGAERYAELYLVFANRDSAGPGTLRLGEIIVETVRQACADHSRQMERPSVRSRGNRAANGGTSIIGAVTRGGVMRRPLETLSVSLDFGAGVAHDLAPLGGLGRKPGSECFGVVVKTSAPSVATRSRASGELIAFTRSALTRVTIGLGVPVGATTPHHWLVSKPLTPASCKLGVSGKAKKRSGVVTARARNFPAFTLGNADATDTNAKLAWPPRSSVSAGPAPLYGMCTNWMPVSVRSNSPARCPADPLPGEAKLRSFGRAFAIAMNSLTVRAGKDGCTTKTWGAFPSSATGV